MTFLDEKITVRLRDAELKMMRKAIRKNPDLYDSESHFVRVAVIRELKRVEK
jgi:Arc/MetJ-type ribon-helix-helix transcriptional regulator